MRGTSLWGKGCPTDGAPRQGGADRERVVSPRHVLGLGNVCFTQPTFCIPPADEIRKLVQDQGCLLLGSLLKGIRSCIIPAHEPRSSIGVSGITLVPERNPLLLAKEISVLDHHSKGRFIFGVGAGWNREETTMMGGDFDHRWTQTREAVMALKELWTKDEAEFQGSTADLGSVRKCNRFRRAGLRRVYQVVWC